MLRRRARLVGLTVLLAVPGATGAVLVAHSMAVTPLPGPAVADAAAPAAPAPPSGSPASTPNQSTDADALVAPAAGKDQPVRKNDQIIVLDSGTYQGRHWRLIRDRFVVTVADDEGPPKDLLGGVRHLPYSQYGKPGTVACQALGFQFGDAAPGTLPDYNTGYGCLGSEQGGGKFTTPQKFEFLSYGNPIDKTTGAPTYIEVNGDGPTSWVHGSTAVSAALTIDGVTVDRRALVSPPDEDVAYFGFVVPGTTDHQPKITVTLFDAHGRKLDTVPLVLG
jgi:hypothetical protein